MNGVNLVYPLSPALLTMIGGLVYFLVEKVAPLIPESAGQNAKLRIMAIAAGAALAVLAVPLIPEPHWSYKVAVGAILQGGGVGATVTLGVWAAHRLTAAPEPKAPALPLDSPQTDRSPGA